MKVVLQIPDDFVEQISAGGDIERQALEALALESYRTGRLTTSELRQMLSFATQGALDAFLKAHEVRERAKSDVGARRRMTVEQMLSFGSEMAALPIVDPRSARQITDDINGI
jgi:hypothetical protein